MKTSGKDESLSRQKTSKREVTGEQKERWFNRNGNKYKITISWHFLVGGEKYHYVHVYRGNASIPFRTWRWATTADNEFIKFL